MYPNISDHFFSHRMGFKQGQRKTVTGVGVEPTTFGRDHCCSTHWATRSDRDRWEIKLAWNQLSRHEIHFNLQHMSLDGSNSWSYFSSQFSQTCIKIIGGKLSGVLSITLYRSLKAAVIECAESIELPMMVYLQRNGNKQNIIFEG